MHCWPRYLLWALIAVLGLGNMLTACGQKGDLYLPDEDQQQEEERQDNKGEAPAVSKSPGHNN